MFEKILTAIEALTSALLAHTAALSANPTAAKAATGGKKAAEKPADPVAATPAPATATQTSPANIAQPAANAATAGQAAAGAVNQAEAQRVGALMIRVANDVSRDAAIAILGKYGASGFGAVKPSDWPSFEKDTTIAFGVLAASGLPPMNQRTPEQSAKLLSDVRVAVGIDQPANAAAGLM